MNPRRFEQLVIGAGAVTVVGSVLISVASNGWPGWINLVSQLLLLPVLIVAVHRGRKAGLLAALVASAILVILKLPILSSPDGAAPADLVMIVFTIAAYGLVGIVGGDLCGRVKYFFARYDESATIDDWSHVYNQRTAAALLSGARERYSRYGEVFSVVLIAQAPSANHGAPTRQRAVVRAVANYLRGDVRMVDEVARLDDGRFMVILPHTRREGGLVVTRRLVEGVEHALDAEKDGVSARCLSAVEDEVELASLAATIAPASQSQTGSIA
jgi:GGDEF domain-containing protein